MKLTAWLFTLLMCSTAMAAQPEDHAEWSVSLHTWGMPSEPTFTAVLDHTGHLEILRLTDSFENQSTYTTNISAEVIATIFEKASQTLSEFKFPTQPPIQRDGTSITLDLTLNSHSKSCTYRRIANIAKASPTLGQLVELLNSLAPEDMRIW